MIRGGRFHAKLGQSFTDDPTFPLALRDAFRRRRTGGFGGCLSGELSWESPRHLCLRRRLGCLFFESPSVFTVERHAQATGVPESADY